MMACKPILVTAGLACLIGAGAAAAQPSNTSPLAADQATATPPHRAARQKVHVAAPTAQKSAMQIDDWFSYGPPKEAEIEKEAPGVQIKVHDPHEDDIVVYGIRQKRDFEGAAPEPNLTSPQALDAAQPVVPGIGNSCSYKYGCFDSSQPTLRSDLESLGGN